MIDRALTPCAATLLRVFGLDGKAQLLASLGLPQWPRRISAAVLRGGNAVTGGARYG